MKGCSVCGSSEEHFDGANCVDHLLERLAEANNHPWKHACEQTITIQEGKLQALESRLRDAEARVGELMDACIKSASLHTDKHSGPIQFMSDDLKTCVCPTCEIGNLTPTTGTFDRLRNEVLEEAAKIAENSCLSPPDGGSPTAQEIESAAYAAQLIRAAKRFEQ